MSIKCCKSYVGKEIIGLLPGGGGSPVAPKCLYYAEFGNIDIGFGGLLLDIDGLYFPSTGTSYEFGTSIQSTYQLDAGSWPTNITGQNIKVWSLENDPITSVWQSFNFSTSNFDPITMNLLSCDLTTKCYYVDIAESDPPVINLYLAGNFPGSPVNGWVTGNSGFNTADPQFSTWLQSIFGGKASITIVSNPGSTYIEITDCYEAIHPKVIETSTGGFYSFTECTP